MHLAPLLPRVGSKMSVILLGLCLPSWRVGSGSKAETSTTQVFSPASVTIASYRDKHGRQYRSNRTKLTRSSTNVLRHRVVRTS